MKTTDFSGYILAGGKSSRMGRDKAFLKFGNQTLVENASEILKPVCGNTVKAVINPLQQKSFAKSGIQIPLIDDLYKNFGPLGGIHAALKDSPTKWIFILAVDLPLVKGNLLNKLIELLVAEPECRAILPRPAGEKLQPLCGIYEVKQNLAEIENLLSTSSDVPVYTFLKKIPHRILEISDQSEFRNQLLNINHPRDLRNLSPIRYKRHQKF